jgi:hypothetical protein
MDTIYKTIIIGGGIAGLSCARKLNDQGQDFLLVTKDIGGRIKCSRDGKVNYGALWIGSTYKHMIHYVTRGRKMDKRKVCFYIEGQKMPILSVIFKYPWQFLKSLLLTIRFYFIYRKFQKDSEKMGQKKAILSNPSLKKLYFQTAEEFIEEHKITNFAKTVIEPVLYGIMVSKLEEETAFQYQLMSLSMIMNGYEFRFDAQKFIEPFRHKIVKDEVVSIEKKDEIYLLRTASGRTLKTKNAVVATPSPVAQRLLGLRKINEGKNVYVFHLKGKIKDEFKTGIMKFFGYTIPLFGIAEEEDGSYVVYSLSQNVDLREWFEEWQVIALTEWHPIYNNTGRILLDAHEGKNLWLIGDENVIGMEDTFITGLYVANEIIKS